VAALQRTGKIAADNPLGPVQAEPAVLYRSQFFLTVSVSGRFCIASAVSTHFLRRLWERE